jgi:hypothetical protein
MFEQLRESLRSMIDNTPGTTDRRAALAGLKEALVHARMGVGDLRAGVEQARGKTEAARAELATIARRKALAAQIGDTETVAVAERFEKLQEERVDVLARKLDAQERELALAEREVGEMSADFRRAMAGVGSGTTGPTGAAARDREASAEVDALLGADLHDGEQADSQRRADARAQRSVDADARLAELKRRMGK